MSKSVQSIFRIRYSLQRMESRQLLQWISFVIKKEFLSPTRNIKKNDLDNVGHPLIFQPFIYSAVKYADNEFSFLNLRKGFKAKTAWGFSDYGKLWLFNLNSFEFLHQSGVMKDKGIELI